MVLRKWASVGVGLVLAVLLQTHRAQVILTKTNSEGSYTTGNRLDLPEKLELFSPITFDIPLLLDTDLYTNMTQYQSYKNNWIIDIGNIDPKVAAVDTGIRSGEPQLQHRRAAQRNTVYLPRQVLFRAAAASAHRQTVLRLPRRLQTKGQEPQGTRKEVRKQNLHRRRGHLRFVLPAVLGRRDFLEPA